MRFAGLSVCSTVLGAGLVCAVLAADWPQFLGPTRNGVSTETGLATTWPKEGPPQVWEKKVGAGWSGPIVSAGRVILFHRLENREVVESLDAATGKPQWKFDYATGYVDKFGFDDGPRATPLVGNGRVYTLGAEGHLLCLDLEKGTKVWERALLTDYQVPESFFGVGSSPLLDGDRLLVNVGGKEAGVVAFDAATGKEAWKATSQEASYSSPAAATINGARHVVFLTREGILSVDPANGKVRFSKRWRSKNKNSVNAATPLVIDDLLFISASYDTGAIVHRVGKDGIEEVWNKDDVLSNQYNTSVPSKGYLYGIDGRADIGVARLRCVELKTGKVLWTKTPFGCATLVLTDGLLIALTEKGELVLIEATPDAYREKSRAAVLTKPCRSAPALANGRLYARDGARLVCWNLKK
jgi:outer membrane protein assembly factor BamB